MGVRCGATAVAGRCPPVSLCPNRGGGTLGAAWFGCRGGRLATNPVLAVLRGAVLCPSLRGWTSGNQNRRDRHGTTSPLSKNHNGNWIGCNSGASHGFGVRFGPSRAVFWGHSPPRRQKFGVGGALRGHCCCRQVPTSAILPQQEGGNPWCCMVWVPWRLYSHDHFAPTGGEEPLVLHGLGAVAPV